MGTDERRVDGACGGGELHAQGDERAERWIDFGDGKQLRLLEQCVAQPSLVAARGVTERQPFDALASLVAVD